jgi:signal transduction histidine kinase
MDVWDLLEVGAIGMCVGLIAIGLIRLPRSRVAPPLLGVAGCAVLWGVGELLTATSRELTQEQIGIALVYTGGIFLPPLWWMLALRWAEDRGSPLPFDFTRWTRIPLAWAIGMWLVMLTNPWHELLLTPVVGDWNIRYPLWWVLAGANYVMILGVIVVELWVVQRVRAPDVTRQAAFMIGASLVVLLPNRAFLLGLAPQGFNPTFIVLASSGALLFAGMRYEEDRRQFEQRLTRQVALRTQELNEANRSLRSANTRLRELQERLVQAERLDATEYLAGSVAHAINNPLTALCGTVEMALSTRTRGDPTLDRVLTLARRIEGVVRGTLALVRREGLQLSPESPRAVLEELAEELSERAATRGVAIELKVPADLPSVILDRTLLLAGLVGIAENSVEAMDRGGHLWLGAETLADTGGIALRIADSGPGVPKDLRTQVFEPFFTTKSGGTGLGLAIAHGVVQGHGGRIRIDDRPGGGALFTVELPLRAPGFVGAPAD